MMLIFLQISILVLEGLQSFYYVICASNNVAIIAVLRFIMFRGKQDNNTACT